MLNNMSDFIDGEQFECEKHKIDYRIACEECQEKSEKLKEAITWGADENEWDNRI